MTNHQPETIRLAPIPLVSGEVYTDDDGNEHQVRSVAVVVTLADGEQLSINLENKFGGWWAPDDGAIATT